MRKRMIAQTLLVRPPLEQRCLDLESSASVEITSEDAAFPIESALLQQEERGWRADEPGVQTIRLIFDAPQELKRISLVFEEAETSRTQEFTLRWSPDQGNYFGKSSGSSGISARRTPRAKPRITLLNSLALRF